MQELNKNSDAITDKNDIPAIKTDGAVQEAFPFSPPQHDEAAPCITSDVNSVPNNIATHREQDMQQSGDRGRFNKPYSYGPPGENPPPPKLTPMMLINEISKLFRDRIRDENMQNSYRMLLFHLAIRGGRTQLELANMTHLKPPTISVTLQKMEADGYVKRVTNEHDMRQTLVYLTAKGEEYNNNIHKKIDVLDKQISTGFTEEELEKLILLLIRIKNNIYQTDDGRTNSNI